MDNNKKTFIGLASAAAISMFGVGMVVSGLPARVVSLAGGDASLVGLLASCFALPYIFLQVPFGNLSDRYGFKPFLLLGYFLSGISGIIYYFAQSVTPIFIGRAVQGAGEIPVWALAPAILSIAYPKHKGKMIGIYTAVIYIMLSMGSLLMPYLPDVFGERGGFLFFSVLCAAGFLIIFFSLENKKPEPGYNKDSFQIRKAMGLLADMPVRIALFGIFLYGCGQGLLFSIAPGWLVTARSYGAMDMGILFFAYYLSISSAQFLFGPLSDRYGRKILMVTGLVCTALCWLFFPYVPKLFSTTLLGLTAGSLGGFFVASIAFLNETAPDHLKGTISGAYYLFWGMGYFLGPIMWGLGGAMFGAKESFFVFSLLLILTSAALSVVKTKKSAPNLK